MQRRDAGLMNCSGRRCKSDLSEATSEFDLRREARAHRAARCRADETRQDDTLKAVWSEATSDFDLRREARARPNGAMQG